MVLAVLTSLAQRISLTSTATRFAIALAVFLLAGRVYSATPALRIRRVLHGKTIVISGGISALSIALARSLAKQGSQVILLVNDPAAPEVLQLLHLLQQETSNERIYCERCDCTGVEAKSVTSIKLFCDTWKNTRRRSPVGDDLGWEPIDTLILLDEERLLETSFGERDRRKRFCGAGVHAKVALIEGIKPVLKQYDTRIINVVSAFYAASPPLKAPAEGELLSYISPWQPHQPWTFASAPALLSIAMMRHYAQQDSLNTLSVSPGVSRRWLFQICDTRFTSLSWLLSILLLPLIWAFGKSTSECVDSVEGALMIERVRPAGAVSKDTVCRGDLISQGRRIAFPRKEISETEFAKQVQANIRASLA